MKQLLLKKIYKLDLEFYVFWCSLETETKDNIKFFSFIFIVLLAFLTGAYFDSLTLEKINF
jgi:hypothetical protein